MNGGMSAFGPWRTCTKFLKMFTKGLMWAFADIHLTAFHVGEFDSISIAIALRNVRL
jgi:hypothetical protein